MRAENLRDGYGVSDIRCYSIDHQTLPMQCLEGLVFTPTIKDVLVKYVEGMGSVLLSLRKIFENLTQLAAQHVQSMITWQRVLGPKSRNLSQLSPRRIFRLALGFRCPPSGA